MVAVLPAEVRCRATAWLPDRSAASGCMKGCTPVRSAVKSPKGPSGPD